MIRLALGSEDPALSQMLAARLRGVTLVSPADCEAIAFLDPASASAEAIHPFLSAGKHVVAVSELCPLETDLEALSAAARESGAQLSLVNADRYLPSRQLIRQQLDAGKLGEPGLVRIHDWQPSNDASPSYHSLVRSLDIAGWLMGKLPELAYTVESAGAAHDRGRFVQVHLGFPGGGMTLINFSNRLPPGDAYHSLSVIGSTGAAYADDHQNMQLLYRGGQAQAVRTGEGSKHFAALVQDFADALAAGRDLSPSVHSWRNVLAVAAAVRRSLESRSAIRPEAKQS